MREVQYQKKLINKIQQMLPGCWIMKNDPGRNQGIPDLLILWNNQWAMLEVKIAESADEQPNQDYYIDMFNHMSFAAFINPQNEEQVLSDLQSAFGADWEARVS